MLQKYKNLTELQRWQEYGRLKREYYEKYGYTDAKTYDAFIKRITDELGI